MEMKWYESALLALVLGPFLVPAFLIFALAWAMIRLTDKVRKNS